MRTNSLALLFVVGLALGACHDAGTGNADLSVEISALSSADVASVTVTVDGPGMMEMQAQLTLTGGTWRGLLAGIPAGTDRVFTAVAADAGGVPIYQGHSGSVTILAGQTSAVMILLQPVTPPPSFGNHAPHIDSLYVSSETVAPGDSVQLVVTASDADNDPLVYAWTTDATSALTAPDQTTTAWSTTTTGLHPVTITVTDPHQAFDAITVTIAADDTGSADITVTINSFPEVQNLILSSGHLVPGVAATATLTASDADGDPLTYAWSDNCGGAWVGTTASAQITVPAGSTATSCTIRADVADGRGGTNFGTLTVGLGSGVKVRASIVTLGQPAVGGGIHVVEQRLETAPRICNTDTPMTCVTGGITP